MLASEIHVPQDIVGLLDLMKHNPEALIYSGGTEILRERATRTVELPPIILCTSAVAELKRMTLTERFLEIGAGVLLSEIEKYSPGSIQPTIVQAIGGIANIPVRNLATIGGNISCRDRFMDLWPVLACLDGLVELRSSGGSKWININRLADEAGRPAIPHGALIARIRIPLERWDAGLVIKIGQCDYPSPETAVFAFTARVEKGMISEFHLILAGERSFRSRELESAIVGRRVPLKEDERHLLAVEYRKHFAERLDNHEPGLGNLPELAFSQLEEL